ncbi:hypothetical protein JIN84_17235 [Luteolibacter yonseiensis]|uniref:Calx-beta domain-containing protein n=1 Tax=Luteolibacter yonseiensis TaxID=1144680 RepID=A0A934R6P8_9BACT|nr:hypothetical protein [Luteolibacter yonseiensis]MBK1817367.1 hypothetical protein [Luteolibacter yonseiensis]
MKTKLVTIAALVVSLAFASGAEKIKAPNGGRIIDSVEPHVEFLVTKEKKVEVRFVDDSGKVVAPAAQTVTVTMGDRSAPTKLAFTKDGDKLVSDKTIPDGDELPVVVQIKVTPDAKSTTEKFNLNLAKCPTCSNAEYACTCAHGGEEKGHDHKEGDDHKH